VPDDVIPDEGRDVQCSNCDKTWFQEKQVTITAEAQPAAGEEVKSTAPETQSSDVPETPSTKPPAGSPNVDPSVASILQEEAARESDLRSREAEALESQPDLGLDEAPASQPAPEETTDTAGEHSDVLPDVDAINSSLRDDTADTGTETAEPAPKKSGGFVRGFALIIVIGVILYLIYGNAQQISATVPQAAPVLDSYVSVVDQARIWLESQAANLQN